MREGTAGRFSCRKHRVPTRCVPDDLLCVFPKKKRKRRALRSRTMNPIGPFVISVVWSRGRRGGPSRTGCRCAAESCRDASRCFGRGGACVFSRRGSRGSLCPAFPCRDGGMPVEAESPSAGSMPSAGVSRCARFSGIRSVWRFYGDAAWNGKEGAIA